MLTAHINIVESRSKKCWRKQLMLTAHINIVEKSEQKVLEEATNVNGTHKYCRKVGAKSARIL